MSAIISDCGKYRYRLERERLGTNGFPVDYMPAKAIAFIGVNPSTADASQDDATIRKMLGFAWRWGGTKIIVGNLFAYRATDVRELRGAYLDRSEDDGIPVAELVHLTAIIRDADLLVPCWGRIDKVPSRLRGRIRAVRNLLEVSGRPVLHLGTTACGQPKHPLMLGYDTPLTAWPTPPQENDR